ncbi:MAG TPA: glycoside hydrolase family 16 protein [Balneolaceae bacterium]|nr:glycoside hydrolase family 16 protein [Balneolaceae bacterium]
MKNQLKIALILLATALLFNSCGTSSGDGTDPVGDDPNNEPSEVWNLVWSDEFEADQLETDKWSFQFGTGSQFGLVGWGNNELQYYTDREENVFLEDGLLHITALEESFEGRNYTSARIRTINKGDWKFGKIEIMAKLPEGQGMWPAIWMLPTEEVFGGWPKSGEIDITELVGHQPSTVHGTVHFGQDWPENRSRTSTYSLDSGKFSENFHLFSIEWEEDEIRWYVDGEQYHTIQPEDLEPENYPFNEQFHLILNLAVGGNWPGNPDSSTVFPQSMLVDYVRVFEKAEE